MDQREHSRTGLCSCLESADLLPFRPEGYGEFESGPLYFTERRGLANWLLLATISGCGMLRYGGCEAASPSSTAPSISTMRQAERSSSIRRPWRKPPRFSTSTWASPSISRNLRAAPE